MLALGFAPPFCVMYVADRLVEFAASSFDMVLTKGLALDLLSSSVCFAISCLRLYAS